jgi:hypothetical protein
MLRVAQREQDSALLVEAHHWLEVTLASLRELAADQGHFEQSLALYDPRQHPSLTVFYGFGPWCTPWRRELTYGARHWPTKGREKKGLPRCAKARPPSELWG